MQHHVAEPRNEEKEHPVDHLQWPTADAVFMAVLALARRPKKASRIYARLNGNMGNDQRRQ